MTKIIFRVSDILNKEVDTFPNKIEGIESLIQYAWKINKFNHPFGIQCEINDHQNGPKPGVFFYTYCPQVANKIVKDFGAEGVTQ